MYFEVLILACCAANVYSDDADIKPRHLSKRILGGEDAYAGQFPYMASIQKLTPSNRYSHTCGGAILNERWILTATHCLSGSDYPGNRTVVKVGKNNIRKHEPYEQVANIKKYFRFRNTKSYPAFDIALIQLRTPLKLDEHVAKIALPKRDSEPIGLATLAGWGRASPKSASILQYINLPIKDLETCKKAVKKINSRANLYNTNICTMSTGRTAGCHGDSGSPLVQPNDRGELEVVGVFVLTFTCEKFGAPQGFVRVSAFIDWIESTVEANK